MDTATDKAVIHKWDFPFMFIFFSSMYIMKPQLISIYHLYTII